MVDTAIREHLVEELDLDVVMFENPAFDKSIIGVTTDGRIVYSFELMIKELMQDDNMSEVDATEFIDYNTIRALNYIEADVRPVIVHDLEV